MIGFVLLLLLLSVFRAERGAADALQTDSLTNWSGSDGQHERTFERIWTLHFWRGRNVPPLKAAPSTWPAINSGTSPPRSHDRVVIWSPCHSLQHVCVRMWLMCIVAAHGLHLHCFSGWDWVFNMWPVSVSLRVWVIYYKCIDFSLVFTESIF